MRLQDNIFFFYNFISKTIHIVHSITDYIDVFMSKSTNSGLLFLSSYSHIVKRHAYINDISQIHVNLHTTLFVITFLYFLTNL